MRRAVLAIAVLAAAATAAKAEGDAAKGEKVFRKCMACHNAAKADNKVGPHLVGIVGRKAGSVEGYKYSAGMIAKGAEGLIWDETTIAAYMIDPKGYIPKNKMAFVGLKKPDEIADVIAFLKSHPAP